jgi:hypothetical protein
MTTINLTRKKIIDYMYKNIKSEKDSKKLKYIEIKELYPLHGIVKNYYHFMMSVFIPLILDIIDHNKKNIEPVYIFNNNFGPMLRILSELPINIIFRFNDRELYEKLERDKLIEQDLFKAYNMHPNPSILKRNLIMKKKGYCDFLQYSDYKSINKWMLDNIREYDLDIVRKADILIIERKVHKSYKIVKQNSIIKNTKTTNIKTTNIKTTNIKTTNIKTTNTTKNNISNQTKLNELFKHSGSEMRSIINHKDFFNMIKTIYPNKKVLNVSLEYTSIFDQYKLFNNAQIVFCQHGASMANILFMKNKSKIVEIIDKNKYELENWFLQLSKTCKIKHYQYITDSAHVSIDLTDFSQYLKDNNLLK